MSNVSAWSTTAASNNSAAPNGFPENMAPSGVNDAMREVMAAIAKWYKDTQGTLTSGGSSNAYTLTTNNAHAALADQSLIVFQPNHTNTGAATLNVDGLGAKAIVDAGGNALTGYELVSGSPVAVVYRAASTNYRLIGNSYGPVEIVAATAFPSANSVTISSIPQGFSSLILTITGVSFDTASRALNIHVNAGGGAYHQVHQYNASTGDDIVEASGDIARSALDQAASETCTMTVVFTGYQAGCYTHASFVGQTRIGGTPIRFSGQGMHVSTTAMTAIVMALNSTGNFDAGTYALHGIR